MVYDWFIIGPRCDSNPQPRAWERCARPLGYPRHHWDQTNWHWRRWTCLDQKSSIPRIDELWSSRILKWPRHIELHQIPIFWCLWQLAVQWNLLVVVAADCLFFVMILQTSGKLSDDLPLKVAWFWTYRALPMGPIGPYKGPIWALYRALFWALFSLCGLPYFPFADCL